MSWRDLSPKERCGVIASASSRVSEYSDRLIDACRSEQRTDPVETITSELLPLCAALRFIGRRGPRILATRRLGLRNRPAWLFGVRSKVERQPLGNVLILGTWNYPLLLPGVQTAQALAAGNTVWLKPAAGTETASQLLVECFHESGVPESKMQLLRSETEAAVDALNRAPDLVVLTGAAETGQKVLTTAAPHLTSSIMELSGCDAVIAVPGFDIERLTACLEFGLSFNSGATCIGPRRLLVHRNDADDVCRALLDRLRDVTPFTIHPSARSGVADALAEALNRGAKDLVGRFDESELRQRGQLPPVVLSGVSPADPIAAADLFAPVLSIIHSESVEESIGVVNQCPYRLAASVFGPRAAAEKVASKLSVGCVTVNDLIVPTADPRIPFGGQGRSGFGVTRGEEGLLAMTTPRVVCTRKGSFLAHLQPRQAGDEEMLHGLLRFSVGRGLQKRLEGLRMMISGVKKSRKKGHP
ncbi:MAG: aldehyde dehydrogenase family protein [Planctomycetota bacterium]